jgi:serine/threonine-protein kinase
MLKHLQEPAPSVLDERPDVPGAVARVVARALEKRPEDRYETVGQLVEDFSIAAGMEATSSGALNSGAEKPVPPPLVDGPDEETVVRRRVTQPMAPVQPPPAYAAPARVTAIPASPPVVSSFKPWKILVPSVIGLLVVFAVIYAFTRNSQPTPPTTGSALAADPNSSPVEPTKPPTGEAEAGIPAGGAAPPTNANANVSASPAATETPTDVVNPDINANTNANKNPPLPSPTRPAEAEPSPTATKTPTPKPTLPPPLASPPDSR